MPKIIEVTVAPNGETIVQTTGYLGSDCRVASRFIEQALGLVTAERKTPEFYSSAAIEQPIRQ